MPDLDDIFEDVFDAVKKRWRKKKKSRKQKKPDHRQAQPTLLGRLFSGSYHEEFPQPAAQQASTVKYSANGSDRAMSSTLRGYLEQAQAYQQGIMSLMRSAPTEFNRSRMEELTRYVDHWQSSLHALVERVNDFGQNELVQQDLRSVPKAISRIEEQLEKGVPKRIEEELKRTLSNRRQQLDSLERLSEMMQWAEVKIENTVSILGTIYSQAMISQSKGQVGNYRRLLEEIEEEALALDDYVKTLQEIKFGQAEVRATFSTPIGES